MRRRQEEQAAPRRALVEPGQRPDAPREFRAWQPLRLDTPVDLLAWADVIVLRSNEYVVARINPVVRGVLALDLASVSTWRNGGDWPRRRERDVPGFTTVGSLALAHGLAATRAYHLPELSWRRFLPPHVIEDDCRLSLAEAFARLPRDAGPRVEAENRVAEIRALYGRMLADIAYRIENSALFDSTVPTTRQFETALALWSDTTAKASDEEVARRSAIVTVAFDTARSHAETVGLEHLPTTAHNSARRAAGAARLARSSSSEAERTSAEARLVTILRSLGLACLPDPASLPRAITLRARSVDQWSTLVQQRWLPTRPYSRLTGRFRNDDVQPGQPESG